MVVMPKVSQHLFGGLRDDDDLDYVTTGLCDACGDVGEAVIMHTDQGRGRPVLLLFMCHRCRGGGRRAGARPRRAHRPTGGAGDRRGASPRNRAKVGRARKVKARSQVASHLERVAWS